MLARFSNNSEFNKEAAMAKGENLSNRSTKPGVAGVITAVNTRKGGAGDKQDIKVYDVDFRDGDFEADIEAQWIIPQPPPSPGKRRVATEVAAVAATGVAAEVAAEPAAASGAGAGAGAGQHLAPPPILLHARLAAIEAHLFALPPPPDVGTGARIKLCEAEALVSVIAGATLDARVRELERQLAPAPS